MKRQPGTIAQLGHSLDRIEHSLMLAETIAGLLGTEDGTETHSTARALDGATAAGLKALEIARKRLRRLSTTSRPNAAGSRRFWS